MKIRPVKILGMLLQEWKHKSCVAHIAEGMGWATIYDVKSKIQGKGHATELLLAIQKHYKLLGIELGGSVALNHKMERLYRKLKIKEYQ